MSVSWGTQYAKMKTNLRLAANRLKLLQKKKTEMAQKARGEIADFLNTNKEDRARIRVESIIREDFVVEAYELLEMFCELLLARFGLIQQMKELDDGIAEAVSSILWVAPRISHEIQEFKIISDQLQQKYGKQFAEAARMNQLPEPSRVAPKLIQKLSVSAPSKLLVEKYLIEIARSANIEFTPDPKVMRDDDDEIATAERNLINFMNEEQIGWSLQNNRNDGPNNQQPPPNNGPGGGPGPNFLGKPTDHYPGGFNPNNGQGGGGGGGMIAPNVSYPPPPQYAAPQPPSPTSSFSSFNTYPQPNSGVPVAPVPSYNDVNQGYDIPKKQNPFGTNTNVPAPKTNTGSDEHIYEIPPSAADDFMPHFPEPPTDFPTTHSVHSNENSTRPNEERKPDELNFDELSKRFEDLKKKMQP
jgi:vacuolar protein sorting-associated protein IST1